jgi:penicillin-binding protein-related factor A (putative recombinase)
LQNEGKRFEEDFKNSIDQDKIYYYRLRDSGSAFGQGNNSLRFSTSNDYDCFIYLQPNFFPFELKSNQGTSFSIQHAKEEKGKDIKLHQIEGLTRASQYEGVYAGFVLNFRKTEHTYWLDVREFNKYNEQTEKKSINEDDVIKYKGILIPQEKKKVRYRYFINKMIEMIKGNT